MKELSAGHSLPADVVDYLRFGTDGLSMGDASRLHAIASRIKYDYANSDDGEGLFNLFVGANALLDLADFHNQRGNTTQAEIYLEDAEFNMHFIAEMQEVYDELAIQALLHADFVRVRRNIFRHHKPGVRLLEECTTGSLRRAYTAKYTGVVTELVTTLVMLDGEDQSPVSDVRTLPWKPTLRFDANHRINVREARRQGVYLAWDLEQRHFRNWHEMDEFRTPIQVKTNYSEEDEQGYDTGIAYISGQSHLFYNANGYGRIVRALLTPRDERDEAQRNIIRKAKANVSDECHAARERKSHSLESESAV